MAEDESKDFFISYNKADRSWAEWIAWQLEAEGYSTIIQIWDFRPGGNFVLQMNEATKNAKRTIAVLSPSYLTSLFAQPEWGAAFAQDPTGTQGKLLPIRIRDCVLEGLLKQIVYIDLVGLDKVTAHNALCAGVRQSRALPSLEPLFPGDVSSPLPPVPSFPGEWPEIWHVPYRHNPFFTGRDTLLASLHGLLVTIKPTALTQARAISGLGGIGKTQTALEYAYRYGHEYRYVFWVNAATEKTLLTEMVQLAARLQITELDAQDQQKIVEALKHWLIRHRDWLLILDNADDLEMASKYLPQTNHIQGHVLLTTRASSGGAHIQIIDVEKMDQDESILLLLRRAHLLATDTPLVQASQQDRADAQAIVSALDGLPLALDQAGAYIEETDTTLSGYLTLYQTRHKDLLSQRGQLPPGHPDTVATTWNLSFQQVEQTDAAAADLLRLCAFLAPDAIPESIITKGALTLREPLAAMAGDPIQFNAAIRTLRRYSLLRRNPKTRTLSLHRLVQIVLQDAMSPDEQQAWAEQTVRAITDVFPFVDSGTWKSAQPYLSHADTCLSLIEQYQISFSETAQFLDAYGRYFHYTAQYELAEPLYQRALLISEVIEGPKHPSTATTLNDLASLYLHQGKYELAEPLYQQVLEHVLGSEHAGIASILNNLASLYLHQGRYEEAEPLFQQALHIREDALEPEHPDTATSLNDLALLYHAQGRYEEAEPLFQRALHIREDALGPEHPHTATSLNNLAGLYYTQGRYEEVEPLFQRALHIREDALGPEHPHITANLNNLAELYRDQGRYEEAEPLYQRVLHIHERVLGSEHPDTATILNNLALLYHAQGRYEEAEPLFQRSLHIHERVLRPEHPDTATSLNNLALLYQDQDKYEEAEPLFQRALHIREDALGPEHPHTAISLNNLVLFYHAQGRYEEAEPLYQRVLSIDTKYFGHEHLEVAVDLEGYADLLQKLDRSEEAASLQVRAEAIRAKQKPG